MYALDSIYEIIKDRTRHWSKAYNYESNVNCAFITHP